MKKGISLVSLIIVIIIMVILAGIVVVTGIGSFQTAELNTFAVEILNIQSAVDEYYFRYEKYPVGADKILNMSEIQNEFKNQFENEIITDEKITFKTVDLTLIGINDTEYGNNNYNNDVYVLSESTGRVYYLAGVEYEEEAYYTLIDKLYDISNISNNVQITSRDVKVYDAIFTPSSKSVTNEPITVLLRLPKHATINNITTTNSKSVGEETIVGMYKQVEINTTSQDKTGNYKIIVNYTYNNVEKTAEYEVENYDSVVPTVAYTEKVEGNLKTVTVTIKDNGAKIKTVKYEKEIVVDNSYFKNYGKKVSNNQFVLNKDEYFTIYVETASGMVATINNMPEDWKASVVDIVDGVPMPKGFVASSATGENKKDSGLVIYEGTEQVTDTNVEEARRSRNQYVWVPVEEFSKFVRKNFNTENEQLYISNKLGTNYWETIVDKNNLPLTTLEEQGELYITKDTLKEVQEMYASVKKYKGFYIARYETGLDMKDKKTSDDGVLITNVHSKMNKVVYGNVRWTYNEAINEDTNGAVQVARGVYPTTNEHCGVISTLVYGVQWDRILSWWLESGAKTTVGETITNVNVSTSYGNYKDSEIELDTFNEGAQYLVKYEEYKEVKEKKPKDTSWLLTTGATEKSRINNIYDIAGNAFEWTMEASNNNSRILRGGSWDYSNSIEAPVSGRNALSPTYARDGIGFRIALYIK